MTHKKLMHEKCGFVSPKKEGKNKNKNRTKGYILFEGSKKMSCNNLKESMTYFRRNFLEKGIWK